MVPEIDRDKNNIEQLLNYTELTTEQKDVIQSLFTVISNNGFIFNKPYLELAYDIGTGEAYNQMVFEGISLYHTSITKVVVGLDEENNVLPGIMFRYKVNGKNNILILTDTEYDNIFRKLAKAIESYHQKNVNSIMHKDGQDTEYVIV